MLQLLGDILLDRSNSVVMTRYVSSRENLRILMNLLRVRYFPRMHVEDIFYLAYQKLQGTEPVTFDKISLHMVCDSHLFDAQWAIID